jgi:hypothetical protein
MATKRTTYLKRQKEQKRIEKALQKRENRMLRRHEKSDESTYRPDTDVHGTMTE